MKRKLLLIGGGGHCHSVLDSAIRTGVFDDFGIVDNTDCSYFGVSVVGTDDDISQLVKNGWTDAFVTVGSIGEPIIRRRLYEMIKKNQLSIPSIIDPTAVIATDVRVGIGTFVGKNTVVNSGSVIGECSIINTGTVIEHDCIIGDFVHVSPGCTVCGQVHIGDDAHVGAGSVVIQQINIDEKVLIGAGSVVVNDIPANVKAYGNPCKVVI